MLVCIHLKLEGELKTMFLDRESSTKTSVPGKRALRFARNCTVDVDKKSDLRFYPKSLYRMLISSSQRGEGINIAVDSFLEYSTVRKV